MKNIIKLAFVLVSFVAFSSANAGVLEVTGTAKATYVISGSDSTTGVNNEGKGIGITNELAFTGSGELDNGWTWKYQVELDDNSSDVTTSDDTRLEVGTPYGTVAAYNTEGSLSTKYSFSAAAYGAGSDNGNGGSINYGTNIDSYNNLQYHTPAGLLPFGIAAKVAVAPSASSAKVSGNSAGDQDTASVGTKVTQYQVTAAPIDGLSIGASYLERTGESGSIQGYEQGGYFAKYALGQFTAGFGKHYVANNISTVTTQATTDSLSEAADAAKTKSFENTAYSIGFKVNDDLTISYENEKSEAHKRTLVAGTAADTKNDVELEIDTIQAAYTMGGMTVSVSMKDISNADYVLAKDEKETLLAVSMAF
jgi:outer membrane protein OmpU